MATKQLTESQARTLELWRAAVGDRPATVYDVFPQRSNQGTAHRRNCERLIQLGALVPYGAIQLRAAPERYTYGSTLRPWNLAALPIKIRETAIVDRYGKIPPTHPGYPFGLMSFSKRIPAAACRQLSIEEVTL